MNWDYRIWENKNILTVLMEKTAMDYTIFLMNLWAIECLNIAYIVLEEIESSLWFGD